MSCLKTIAVLCAIGMAVLAVGQERDESAGAASSSAPATAATTQPPATMKSTSPTVPDKSIPRGARVFIAPMNDNFHDFLRTAIVRKKVPVEVVDDRTKAQFEITGHSQSKKAGAAKIILLGSWHSQEEVSIQVANLETGIVAFGYSYHNYNSAHGKKSSAESCAKHLKNKIEGTEN